ncbi:hypothetical protein BT93_K0461 [Corymbia citriodora subsp. variegata]|nr:hypothetical protein BT93_K0461 [Corymbia citriodora subsp. variegata]
MNLSIFSSAMEGIAWRGWFYTVFILHFVFACQFLLLQPLVSAQDGKADAAELLDRASQSIKVKRYNEALDDLNAAIEADPKLSEAYLHRASTLRQLCRYQESESSYREFLGLKPGNKVAEKELSQLLQARVLSNQQFLSLIQENILKLWNMLIRSYSSFLRPAQRPNF